MSVQDNTEQVLRKLHILLSQSEVYDEAAGTVIVDKQELIGLLQELNLCMYGMMEEYELTQRGKDKAERDTRKVGEAIIRDARHTAEDVYAASVMYTDEALRRAMDIVDETMESLRDSFHRMEKDLHSKKDAIAGNRLELKSQLQDLKDTDKYLQLIEERNKQIDKEKDEEQEVEVSPTAHIKPEIKINKDYFERNGIPLQEDAPQREKEERAAAAGSGRQKKTSAAGKGSQKKAASVGSERQKKETLAVGGETQTKTAAAGGEQQKQAPEADQEARGEMSQDMAGPTKDRGTVTYEQSLDAEMQELEGILKEGMKTENSQAEISGGKIVDVDALADKIAAQTVVALGREEYAKESSVQLAVPGGEEEVYDYGDEPEIRVTPEIRVNLDAEYFKWKDHMEIEDFGEKETAAAPEKAKKAGRFGRKK